MNLLTSLGLDGDETAIAWDITPSYTYGLFECRGELDRRVRSSRERYYYFYIDNWQKPARLCLMERGIRHARVLAYIAAPRQLIDGCVAEQGWCKDMSYAINDRLRAWLVEHLFRSFEPSLVLAGDGAPVRNDDGVGLFAQASSAPKGPSACLRSTPVFLGEEEIAGIVKANDFFERDHNPAGAFQGRLVDGDDGLTALDLATGLVWQRGGTELIFFRRAKKEAEELNRLGFAGRSHWRLPTLEEALSLLRPEKNEAGLYLHPCFTTAQGFIYTGDRHRPGGYWFVDFRQARVFWAGGTLSGGFGRFCCKA